jgi:hypothetical protein
MTLVCAISSFFCSAAKANQRRSIEDQIEGFAWMAAQERNPSGRLRYCFFLTVVDSVVVVFSAGESGLKGSIGFTSVLWLPQIRIAMMIQFQADGAARQL